MDLVWSNPPIRGDHLSHDDTEAESPVVGLDDWRWADMDADPILNLDLAREVSGWTTKELARMSAIARRILYTKEVIA